MKYFYYTIFFSLIFSFPMLSQEIEPKIDTLITHQILKERQKSAFEKLIASYKESSPEIPTKSLLMMSLLQLKFTELTGKSPGYYHTNIKFDTDVSDSERIIINQNLITYLNNLQLSGLLNAKATRQLREKIKQNSFAHVYQLLETAAMKVAYNDWMAPERLSPFIQQLKDSKIITESSYIKLQNDIEKENFTSSIQLLDYFKNVVSIPAYQPNETTKVYLEKIHQKVATVLPELMFTNFQYTIEKDELNSFDDYISYNVIVSLEVDGVVYKQSSWITDELEIKNFRDFGVSEFYQIFNKVLVDKNSTSRLHLATGNTDDMIEAIGIALLEEEQTQMFRFGNSYLKMSYETFENQLTSLEIKNTIDIYKSIGLFDHLQQSEIKKGIELANRKEMSSINDIINSFSDSTYSFDYELTNLDDPYAEILRGYAAISHGAFTPTNIKDNFAIAKETALLEFKFQDKTYQIPLAIDRDWIDTNFFTEIDTILKELSLSGKFYSLDSDIATIIFLTLDQYQHLKKHNLLDFSNE